MSQVEIALLVLLPCFCKLNHFVNKGFCFIFQLAKKYHPDTNKEAGAAEKFQELSEAYEVHVYWHFQWLNYSLLNVGQCNRLKQLIAK